MISTVTVWELSIKRSLGKLPGTESVLDVVRRNEFELLPILPEHADRIATMPHLHRDPFDRMLIAQAAVEGSILVTHDHILQSYGVPVLLV